MDAQCSQFIREPAHVERDDLTEAERPRHPSGTNSHRPEASVVHVPNAEFGTKIPAKPSLQRLILHQPRRILLSGETGIAA